MPIVEVQVVRNRDDDSENDGNAQRDVSVLDVSGVVMTRMTNMNIHRWKCFFQRHVFVM